MRSFARVLPALLILLSLTAPLQAQSSNARQVYTEALKREAELRREIDAHQAASPVAPLLQRVRTLVGAYADMARVFPNNDLGDSAIWQGAMLSADTFWRFGDEIDRAAALNLLDALTTRYPGSPRTAQASPHVRRLSDAPVLTPVPAFGDATPPVRASSAPAPREAGPDPTAAPAAESAETRSSAPAAVAPPPTSAAAIRPVTEAVVTAPTGTSPSAVPAAADAARAAASTAADRTEPPPARATVGAVAADTPGSVTAAPASPPGRPGTPPALEPRASSAPRSTPTPATPAGGAPAADPLTAPPTGVAAAAPAPSAATPRATVSRTEVPAPLDALVAAAAPAVAATAGSAPGTASPARGEAPPARTGPARLTAISGESFGEAIRFTLEVERQIGIRHHQLGGPPRVIIDLQDTAPADTLTQALLPEGADVVSRIRVGRHDGTWTRIVIELRAPSRYAVFVVEDQPYRVLIEVHPRLAGLSTEVRGGDARAGR